MWMRFNNIGELEEQYLIAIGKAIAIAQHFEDTCKNVLMLFDCGKALKDNEDIDLDYIFKHSEEYTEKILGLAIKKFSEIHNIESQKVDLLKKAKDARNYIVHESAVIPFGYPSANSQIVIKSVELKEKVFDLAQGYNIISMWAYSIEEKSPPPFTISSTYPDQVLDWVFEDIDKIILTSRLS